LSYRVQRPPGIRRNYYDLAAANRVAHASRVLAMTSRHRGLSREDCFGETPKPTRETRALPDPHVIARAVLMCINCAICDYRSLRLYRYQSPHRRGIDPRDPRCA